MIALGRTLLDDIYSSTPLASTTISTRAYRNDREDGSDHEDLIILPAPTQDEIAKYFALINPLKYSQPHRPISSPFSPPLGDLTITAYNAGHSLGGTIWHIQLGLESIVYAVDWSQAKENVFSGAAWLQGTGGTEVIEQLRKPTALICSAKGSEKTSLAGGRAKRDAMLIELVRSCIDRSGTVLIPTDSNARALELAYVLEHAWRREASEAGESNGRLRNAKLFMAGRSFDNTVRHASSMLEWMETNVIREFESFSTSAGRQQHKRGNSKQGSNTGQAQSSVNSNGPFDFRYVKKLQSRKSIEKALRKSGPRVFLASDASIAWGFSKDILAAIAENSDNLIILTEEGSHDQRTESQGFNVRNALWQRLQQGKASVTEQIASDGSVLEFLHAGGIKLNITNDKRGTLEGQDLNVYRQYLATRRQVEGFTQMESQTALEASADVEDASSSSSSDDESDPEVQGKALNLTSKASRLNKIKLEPTKEALGVNALLRLPGIYDFGVRNKKGRDQMFPVVHRRRRADEFGELIKPEEYLRAEERNEADASDEVKENRKDQQGLGLKRKWQEPQIKTNGHENRNTLAPNKRRQKDRPRSSHLDGKEAEAAIKTRPEEPSSTSESESDTEWVESTPSKLHRSSHTVDAHLKIAFVDFAGLHDQRSLSMLIPLIQPKKLVLTAGSPSETDFLASECRKFLNQSSPSGSDSTDNVFAPKIGEKVNASVDTNAWIIKLSEALSRQLHWQKVDKLGVVTLAGQLGVAPPEDYDETADQSKKKLKLEDGSAEAGHQLSNSTALSTSKTSLAPILDILPAGIAAAPALVAQALHVGDLKLADLRRNLQSNDHTAEFRGEGTLLIDGIVAIRKSATGKIEVEGGSLSILEPRVRQTSSPFSAVQREIYKSLAVIAGG